MKTRKSLNEIKLSYQELRKIALNEGVKDNKVSVGIWIKLNGFYKHHSVDQNRKSYYYYTQNQ